MSESRLLFLFIQISSVLIIIKRRKTTKTPTSASIFHTLHQTFANFYGTIYETYPVKQKEQF